MTHNPKFQCGEKKPSGEQCGRPFATHQGFVWHLFQYHGVEHVLTRLTTPPGLQHVQDANETTTDQPEEIMTEVQREELTP